MTTPINSSEEYNPPTGKVILAQQNEPSALRLLIAQRKLYTKSKSWLSLRLIGMGVIGIAAPLLTLLSQDSAVIVGAIAGTWIFLGRTAFILFEKNLAAKGAATQEFFDLSVFSMPTLGERSPSPTPEELAKLAGPDKDITKIAAAEKLVSWYSVDPADDGHTSVAICQRTNTAYSSDLLKRMSAWWLSLVGIWVFTLITTSIAMSFSLSTFLLGVFLPLLPAFLDTFEYWKGIKRARSDRDTLSSEIQIKIENNDVSSEDLLIWQSRMYDLRRDAAQVPDFLYKFSRDGNERVMKNVASQLSKKARKSK